jgi:hypothetical protein
MRKTPCGVAEEQRLASRKSGDGPKQAETLGERKLVACGVMQGSVVGKSTCGKAKNQL